MSYTNNRCHIQIICVISELQRNDKFLICKPKNHKKRSETQVVTCLVSVLNDGNVSIKDDGNVSIGGGFGGIEKSCHLHTKLGLGDTLWIPKIPKLPIPLFSGIF